MPTALLLLAPSKTIKDSGILGGQYHSRIGDGRTRGDVLAGNRLAWSLKCKNPG